MSDSKNNLRLTLVRHAKSSWKCAGLDDFHRPLNRRGLSDAVMMPAQISKRIAAPQLLVSSAAVRAVQTAQAVFEHYQSDSMEQVIDAALYLASAPDIIAYLAANARDVRHAFVVAHNPGLTDLYNYLVPDSIDNLPTFAVADLELTASGWRQVVAGCAHVRCLLLPKELRST